MKALLRRSLILMSLLALWQLACHVSSVPSYITPTPLQVAQTLWSDRHLLMTHTVVTLMECLGGIALSLIIGVPLAIAMFRSPQWERSLPPLLTASQAVPFFALAPLLILWFGYGLWSKIAMATLIIFFPVTISLLKGLKNCDSDMVDQFRLMDASFGQTFRYLYWPSALPQFFSGLKIGVTVSVIGAVIGEWIGAQQGLGYWMLQSNARLRTDRVFAAIVCLTVMGTLLWSLTSRLEQKVLFWRNRPSNDDANL